MIADKFKVESEVGTKILAKYIALRFLSDYHLIPRDNTKKPIIMTDDFMLEQMIKFDKECEKYLKRKKRRLKKTTKSSQIHM